MKQDLSTAKSPTRLISLLSLALVMANPGCAKLPLNTSSHQEQAKIDSQTPEAALRMNINTASATKLEKLPGVGKVIAERIVTYRAQYGPFRRAEHLMMVRGISDRKFRAIRPLIVVE